MKKAEKAEIEKEVIAFLEKEGVGFLVKEAVPLVMKDLENGSTKEQVIEKLEAVTLITQMEMIKMQASELKEEGETKS